MNTNDDAAIETLVLRKMAIEAFNMLHSGEILKAKTVFSALAQKKPEARAPLLGLSIVDFALKDIAGAAKEGKYIKYDDPLMDCVQALAWLREGRKSEAKALLERAIKSEDEPTAELADVILTTEVGG